MINRDTCKRNLCKRATLSIRAPSGEFEGGSLQGLLERQMKECSGNGASLINFINLILTPFLNPDYVRILSLGAIWNFC
jgi:hypothetical protein